MIKNALKLIVALVIAVCLTQTSQAQYPQQATGYTNFTFTVIAATSNANPTVTSFYSGQGGRPVLWMTISNSTAHAVNYSFGTANANITTNVTLYGVFETLPSGGVLTFPSTAQPFIPPSPMYSKTTTNNAVAGALDFKAFTH